MAEPATYMVKTGSENEPAIVHCKLKTQCIRETHYHNSKGECIFKGNQLHLNLFIIMTFSESKNTSFVIVIVISYIKWIKECLHNTHFLPGEVVTKYLGLYLSS